jgi:hypothetical protein
MRVRLGILTSLFRLIVEEILSKNLERRGNDIFIQEHLR